MPAHGNINGLLNMLRNLLRQSFWVVFAPLLLAAGLFWMDELRGYRAEMSLLVLPKTQLAAGAAGNLAALGREVPFALSVYENGSVMESPLVGKTPAQRKAIWKKTVTINLVPKSDIIHISSLGSDRDEALQLTKAVLAELVRTGSRYYNQKTDVDLRVIEEPVMIPSFTAWPRFLVYIVGTALFFTVLFFAVYSLIDRLFPKRRELPTGNGEYVISPDTFKPRVPAYWGREEHVSYPTETAEASPVYDDTTYIEEPVIEAPLAEDLPTDLPEDEEYVEEAVIPEVIEDEVPAEELYEEEVTTASDEPAAPVYAGYVSHAAAPDNLPIIEESITPLQGAQARLMKADIDATAAAYASEAEAALPEEPALPQTHEPTPEEYRRRLNELLSGKM